MHLIFLPLLGLATASDVVCEWEVVNMGTKTCHNSQRIAKTFDDLDTCKGDCEADGDCIQIFWQSPEQRGKSEPKCHRYRACSQLRTPPYAGSNIQLNCGVPPVLDMRDLLQTTLDTTGCTSGIYAGDARTDTSAWETMAESKNVQPLFEDLFDTCYQTKRGSATEAEQTQCCGEAAMEVHENSVKAHEDHGGVIIHTCGPYAPMIPFTGTAVSSNPPECKQLYNYQCEALTYHEKMARALKATGCPNPNPDTALFDDWIGKTDAQLWGNLQDYCEVVQKNIGGAGTQERGRLFCCGADDYDCMPEHCTTQTDWDCGEPSCPMMEDTKINGGGIETYIENSAQKCQTHCQLHAECQSWSWTGVLCYLYKDTVSTSTRSTMNNWVSGYKCNKRFKCYQGQGQSGSKYAAYDVQTEAECAAKCHEDTPSGSYGTHTKKPYSCVSGQGASGQSKGSYDLNNRDLCAQKCNSVSSCIGFDFTTNKQGDACRIYYSTSSARVGNEGSDDRKWCYQVTQPCVGFDFTETDIGDNSCRVYRTKSNPRYGEPGDDDRLWCEEHTGGFLPEADYDCQAGGAPDPAYLYYKSDETPLECARRCSNDAACAGFDFSFESSKKCRLMGFDKDKDQITAAGSAERRWCRRLTFSERTNSLCDDLNEEYCEDARECRWRDNQCTMEDTIWCRNGRIHENKSKWDDYYEKYSVSNAEECWDNCKASPHCFAYEYKGSDCHLYDAHDVLDTYDRYVYDPGCEDSSEDGLFCNDEIPDDNGWKYCRRIAVSDISWFYSSSQQWWAPSRP